MTPTANTNLTKTDQLQKDDKREIQTVTEPFNVVPDHLN